MHAPIDQLPSAARRACEASRSIRRAQLEVTLPRRRDEGARRRCSFDLPVDLANRFRAVCTLQGHQMREVAQSLFEAYVETHQRLLPE